jgi:biotin carboxylase
MRIDSKNTTATPWLSGGASCLAEPRQPRPLCSGFPDTHKGEQMTDLIVLAHVPTEAVNLGFLPAARRLGLSVTLLTDHAEAHRRHFSTAGLPAYPDEIVACDVFNPLAVIEAIGHRPPRAIFSNSDHLQTSTAIAAAYFDLPGKAWPVTYRAKNKAAMREFLAAAGQERTWHAVVVDPAALTDLGDRIPLPCIVKPREGVGSQHVRRVDDPAELARYCASLWSQQPGRALLLEEYIEGPLYTLETLGDGERLVSLGGWRVILGPPPHFVELEAHWGRWLSAEQEAAVRRVISAFGVGFGACHTEFVLTDHGPRLIEINYRTVGDQREFLLDEALGFPLFETVLRLHLGEPLAALPERSAAAAIRYFPTSRSGELTRAPASFERADEDAKLRYRPLRQVGERVAVTHSNKDYLGVLSGIAADAARLDAAMQAAQAGLTWELGA